ncbi:MAG: FAD-binding oxidoreductase [Halieaceae bacterium]
MKRRQLLKGALAGGIAASSTGRAVMAAMTPDLSGVSAATLSGSEVALSKAAVQGLASSLTGTVLQAQSPSYDSARSLWNAMIDKRPAIIAQCASTADVASAVNFAREHNLLTSVRCGGHSFAGRSVAENGLMIDLGPMHDVSVDTRKKTAMVGGGARLGHVDLACLEHNLITVVGTDSDTGAGGLTLGGGLGRLSRKHGLTIDNLLSAEIVMADGQVRTCSARQETDLFWAIRGGGGNFGVATRFEYQLHDFDPIIYGGSIVFPWERRAALFQYLGVFAHDAPDELCLSPFLFTHPEHGPLIGVEACYSGDHITGAEVLAPLAAFPKPLMGGFGPKPYIDMQRTANPDARDAHYIKSGYVAGLSDGVIEAISENFPQMPGLVVFFQHLRGAVARVDEEATAFSHRGALFNVGIAAGFKDKSKYPAYRDAIRTHWARLEPHTMGFYSNLMEQGEKQILVNLSNNRRRLQKLKARYDPDNFFRLNANIKPVA